MPPAVRRNPLEDSEYVLSTRASKTLLPGFFKEGGVEITKAEYYMVAEQMLPAEIPSEVTEKLDLIANTFGLLA
jgi:hypothetical protein